MALRTVGLRERRVRRVAQHPRPERHLGLAREPALGGRLEHLRLHEHVDPALEIPVVRGHAEKARDAVRPEGVAEDARRARHAPCRRLEALDAQVRHRQDGARQGPGAATRRHVPYELLEVESVAVGALDDASDAELVGAGWKRRANELLGGPRSETRQREIDAVRALPEARAKGMGVGATEPDHRERSGAQRAERVGEVGETGVVDPLQIVDHHEKGSLLAERSDPPRERAAQAAGHDTRVVARRAKALARARLGRCESEQLAEEIGDPRRFASGAHAPDVHLELGALRVIGDAFGQAGRLLHEAARQGEGRPRRERVASCAENPAIGGVVGKPGK